jgi:hypothetical protein
MSPDVAGATIMAIGTSSPELFINIVGTFITQGDIGVGTIVGSAAFNILAAPACCGLFTGFVRRTIETHRWKKTLKLKIVHFFFLTGCTAGMVATYTRLRYLRFDRYWTGRGRIGQQDFLVGSYDIRFVLWRVSSRYTIAFFSIPHRNMNRDGGSCIFYNLNNTANLLLSISSHVFEPNFGTVGQRGGCAIQKVLRQDK